MAPANATRLDYSMDEAAYIAAVARTRACGCCRVLRSHPLPRARPCLLPAPRLPRRRGRDGPRRSPGSASRSSQQAKSLCLLAQATWAMMGYNKMFKRSIMLMQQKRAPTTCGRQKMPQ